MTGPIVFLPTPKVATTAAADAEASWSSVASTTNQNFQRVNDYIRNGKPWPACFTTKLSTPLTAVNQSDWQTIGSTWPALTLPIPQGCRGLWIINSVQCETTPGSANSIAVSVVITGAGITGIPEPWWLAVGGSGMVSGASRILMHPANLLVPGQNVTFTPSYIHNLAHAPGGGKIDVGELYVIPLV